MTCDVRPAVSFGLWTVLTQGDDPPGTPARDEPLRG